MGYDYRAPLRPYWLAAAGMLMLAGCGSNGDRPDLGAVTGTVTLDGDPLANARVTFRHAEGGRSTQFYTDESGHYRAIYLTRPDVVYGAKVGPTKVLITTRTDEDEPGGPQEEKVPECYRGRDSILNVDIEEGENVMDFALTSDCAPPDAVAAK